MKKKKGKQKENKQKNEQKKNDKNVSKATKADLLHYR